MLQGNQECWSACSSDCLLEGNIANSGLGQINLVSYRIDSTLAFKFSLEIKL